MIQSTKIPHRNSKLLSAPTWRKLPSGNLDPELREGIEVLSLVLPFRTNKYVMDELIDWTNVPMTPSSTWSPPLGARRRRIQRSSRLGRNEAAKPEIDAAVERIRNRLNPHRSGK